MAARLVILSALLALVLAPASLRAEEEPSAPAAEAPAAAAAGPEIQLLEAGAEPRVALRYRPKVGLKESMDMTMILKQTITMQGMEQPAPGTPPMAMSFSSEVLSIAEDGAVTARMTLDSVEFEMDETAPDYNPMMAEALKQAVAPMSGLQFKLVVTDRGLPRSVEIENEDQLTGPSAQVFSQMRDSMTEFSMPLPEEPLGVGGRWRTRETDASQGWALTQVATYEVTKIEGDVVHLRVEVEQTADDQVMDTSKTAMPPGAEATVRKHRGQGTGDGRYDLGMLMPLEANMSIEASTQMDMSMMGQEMPMDIKTSMTMEVEGRRETSGTPSTPTER